MTDRYNPFGLPYLNNPADTPDYSVDSRWPDEPSTADAYRMGGLAAMDQYRFQDAPHAVFGAYDREQGRQAREDAKAQDVQRQLDEARGRVGLEGPSDPRPLLAGQRAGDAIGEMFAPDDVFGAATFFNPLKRLGAVGKALPALGGVVLGADEAQAKSKPGIGAVGAAARKAASTAENWAPPASLFDYSHIHDVPDVKQFDLERYQPKHGVSARAENLIKDKGVQNQMLDLIEQGKGINAETFYYNEPLRQAFISELGKKEGPTSFQRYMDYVAATSPRSDVETNARNASYYYMLDKQGLPVPEKGGVNPQPYGHMAQNLHRQNASNIRSGDYFDVVNNPKPLSFSQNLQGNFAPVTVDAHAFKLPAMLKQDPEFLAGSLKLEKGAPTINPTKMYNAGELSMEDAVKRPVFWDSMPNRNEYGAMEQYYKRLAKEAGMTPAQVQAAAWAGGGKITGLESVAGDPFMRSVENRANKTAAARGISPAEALSQMMRGKAPLLGLGGAAVVGPGMMGGLAAQDNYQQ